MPKLIYIADDDQNIRNLIARFLYNDGFEAEGFPDGDSLLRAFTAKPADLLILDIMMPGTDGLSLCGKIRENYKVPIIIVSARDSELDRISGIYTGSDDYLVKPFSPLELVARVRALFRRISLDGTGAEERELRFGDLLVSTGEHQVYLSGQKLDLTPTEYSLLVYLTQNSGKAVSREELLRSVWRFESEVDTRATDDVVKRLRKKLLGSVVHIVSVWGFGFKLETFE